MKNIVVVIALSFLLVSCGGIGKTMSKTGRYTIKTYSEESTLNIAAVDNYIKAIDGVLGLIEGFFVYDKETQLPVGIQMIAKELEEMCANKRDEAGNILPEKFTELEKNKVVALFSRMEYDAAKTLWDKRETFIGKLKALLM